MSCPYFSRSGHVVLAESCLLLQQAGGKLPPVWPKPCVAKCHSRGAGAPGQQPQQLKGGSPGVGPLPESGER